MTIITLSDARLQTADWQWHLRNGVRSVSQLAELLELNLPEEATDFPLLVPLPFVHRMKTGDPDDPLLRQILPTRLENTNQEGYVRDPLNEISFTGASRGIVRKYTGRALVITTGTCAVNCRYCFRRHFPYKEHQASKSSWQGVADYLHQHPEITEVILSGGDPLVLIDDQLSALAAIIDEVDHVQTLRLHTRVPVVIPQRISDSLLQWIEAMRFKVVFVLHINHANELDDHLRGAIARLTGSGVTLLNQSVLLSGVNDSPEALVDLSTQLFHAGVLPYYLHLLDPVAGAMHFDVPEERGRELMRDISKILPGYLVPKLVKEIPGAASKQIIASS